MVRVSPALFAIKFDHGVSLFGRSARVGLTKRALPPAPRLFFRYTSSACTTTCSSRFRLRKRTYSVVKGFRRPDLFNFGSIADFGVVAPVGAYSLAWKHFSANQIACLEATLEHDQCKKLLATYLRLGKFQADRRQTGRGDAGDDTALSLDQDLTDKDRVVLNFHYYNYAFCKERRLDARATSTLLSILKEVFDEDMRTNDETSSLRASFDRFQELILRHAVERLPWTTGILSSKDIGAIVDYVSTSYYRHFHLYKHIFTTRVTVIIEQHHPHGVEEPFVVAPLRGALVMSTHQPASDQHINLGDQESAKGN